jgi:hypothetical protein
MCNIKILSTCFLIKGPSELAENGDEGSLAESSKPSCDTPASERDKSPGDSQYY